MLKYYLGNIVEPNDEGQDMWTGEISIDAGPNNIAHSGCVEVHGESEELMNKRVKIILEALNMNITRECIQKSGDRTILSITPEPEDGVPRATTFLSMEDTFDNE